MGAHLLEGFAGVTQFAHLLGTALAGRIFGAEDGVHRPRMALESLGPDFPQRGFRVVRHLSFWPLGAAPGLRAGIVPFRPWHAVSPRQRGR